METDKTAEAKAYDPAARYDVKFSRVVPAYGVKLLPIDTHDMDGATLNMIVETEGADCVDRAEPR